MKADRMVKVLVAVLLAARPYVCCSELVGDPNRHVIFVHGFNVSEQEARGWASEMFKRLYRSGNKAQFTASTWQGDEGWPDPGVFYHQNVANAFAAAPGLAADVNALPGTKVVIAHSLGNMVVASAIADHGMGVDKFIMLNAAIPVEAFDPDTHNESPAGNPMLHSDWVSYQKKAWASCWHEHFRSSDDRSKLTWKGRFANIPPSVLYNFYSPGDEVLEIWQGAGALRPRTGGSFRRYAWQKQERFKGRSMMYGTSWSGWGFGHPTHSEWVLTPESLLGWTLVTQEYYPDAAAANAAPARQLRNIPVFNRYPGGMFTNSIPLQLRNEILAKGIPALSPSAGNCEIPTLVNVDGQNHNFNLDTPVFKKNGWYNHPTYGKVWLHSDCKDLAYFYVHELFKKIIDIGELE